MTTCRGYPKSTWWDEPPEPPSIAEYLPDHVSFGLLDAAMKDRDAELIGMLKKPTEEQLLKSYLSGMEREQKPSGPKVTEDGIEIPSVPGGMVIPKENQDPMQSMREWVRKRVSKTTGMRPQDIRFAAEEAKLKKRAEAAAPEWKKTAEVERRPEVEELEAPEVPLNPALRVALLFPGQGSEYVSMISGMAESPAVAEYAETAKRVLGFDLLEVCLYGPEKELEKPTVCHAAMYLAGMAALEKLRMQKPEVVDSMGAVAGLSVGEYTALCAAGVFSFEEGLELVKIRAEAMEEAASVKPQAMLSVAGLDRGVLEKLCKEHARDGEICEVVNVLFPRGFTCAGTKDAIERLHDAAQKAGAMQAKLLRTSGGFHTELMRPAQERLDAALKRLLPKMNPPKCDVYMNATGRRLGVGTPPNFIAPLLVRQLCTPVLWEASVRSMSANGLTEFYEVGPLKQLRAMMKRIDMQLWSATSNVEV